MALGLSTPLECRDQGPLFSMAAWGDPEWLAEGGGSGIGECSGTSATQAGTWGWLVPMGVGAAGTGIWLGYFCQWEFWGGECPPQPRPIEQHGLFEPEQFPEGPTAVEPRGLGCCWTSPCRPIHQQGRERSLLFSHCWHSPAPPDPIGNGLSVAGSIPVLC